MLRARYSPNCSLSSSHQLLIVSSLLLDLLGRTGLDLCITLGFLCGRLLALVTSLLSRATLSRCLGSGSIVLFSDLLAELSNSFLLDLLQGLPISMLAMALVRAYRAKDTYRRPLAVTPSPIKFAIAWY